MCLNELLAGIGDPPGVIYPAGYWSGEIPHPQLGMGILVVSNYCGGDEYGVLIPDGDLPIAIFTQLSGGKE